jgi:hypothetical protein
MFAVGQQEVKKGSHRIQCIGQHQVERPWVTPKRAAASGERFVLRLRRDVGAPDPGANAARGGRQGPQVITSR